jgi:hypothetical protein
MIWLLFACLQQDVAELAAKAAGEGAAAYAAMDDLVDLGPGAIARLEPLVKADATGRLARVIDQIRFEQRMKDRVRAPTRITHACKEAKALTALREIARQSEESIDLSSYGDSDPGPEITLDLRRQTFWRALDAACTASRGLVDLYEEVFIEPDEYLDAPRFVFRNFYVRLDGLRLTHLNDFRDKPEWRATLDLLVMSDSGAGAHAYRETARLDAVEDDTGRSLIRSVRDAKSADEWNAFAHGGELTTPCISAPAKEAKALRFVRGRVVLAYATKLTKLDFGKADAGATREAGGLKFEILPGTTGEVPIRITGPEAVRRALSAASFIVRARGVAGTSRSHHQTEAGEATTLHVRTTAGHRARAPLESLEIDFVEAIEERDFAFEFKDVKLP